jgi:hypothetical protein
MIDLAYFLFALIMQIKKETYSFFYAFSLFAPLLGNAAPNIGVGNAAADAVEAEFTNSLSSSAIGRGRGGSPNGEDNFAPKD